VKSRPLKFSLKSGVNGVGAYLNFWYNFEHGDRVKNGSNSNRVDEEPFTVITKILNLMDLPLELSFESRPTFGNVKICDGKKTMTSYGILSNKEMTMVANP